MKLASFGSTLRQMLQRAAPPAAAELGDGDLLDRFVAERDETAFTALLARHGSMVFGVCRRVLRDGHAADDVFQATFLVLARKAAVLDGHSSIASWLYAVARNLALKKRLAMQRRRAHEKEAAMQTPSISDDAARRDLYEVLDLELGRLPEKYRVPLVLCHLEGKTHETAAAELGWPVGSMAKRLARGQELLRERLAGRGLALSTMALTGLLAENGVAAISPATQQACARAAALFVAGHATGEAASAQAATLAAAGLRAMSTARFKIAPLCLLGVSVTVASSAGLIGYYTSSSSLPSQPVQAAQLAAENTNEVENDPAGLNMRGKLDMRFTLGKGVGAGATLGDVLSYFGERFDFKVVIDHQAFADVGAPAIAEHQVTLPKMKEARLGTAIRLAAEAATATCELRDGKIGGYRVEGGRVVIVPVDPLAPDESRLPRSWYRRLLRPVRLPRDFAGATTLGTALELLGDRYGVKFAVDEKSFRAFGATLPSEQQFDPAIFAKEPDGDIELPLVDILGWCFSGLRSRDHDYVQACVVKPDVIELTCVKRDSPRANLLLYRDWRKLQDRWSDQVRMDSVRHKLSLAMDVEVSSDTVLRDWLVFFDTRFNLDLLVNRSAFVAVRCGAVDETQVSLRAKKELVCGAALQQLLDQIKADDWTAKYVVHEDGFVEIVPLHLNVRDNKPLTREQLDGLRNDLFGEKGLCVRLAAETLAHFPEQTVPLLAEGLKPAPEPDPDKVAEVRRWLNDLDSEHFEARRRASEALEKIGGAAIGPLKERLRQRPSLELRTRIEHLLAKLQPPPPTPEDTQYFRTIRVLEEIGTPAAEAVLEKLARGHVDARRTEQARAALERLRN